MSVLLLALTLSLDTTGGVLRRLCRWIVAEDAWARAEAVGSAFSDTRLFAWDDPSDTRGWRDRGWRLLVEPGTPHPPAADAALLDVTDRLIFGVPPV